MHRPFPMTKFDPSEVGTFLRDDLPAMNLPRLPNRPTAVSSTQLYTAFRKQRPSSSISHNAFGVALIRFYDQPWFPFSFKQRTRDGNIYHYKR